MLSVLAFSDYWPLLTAALLLTGFGAVTTLLLQMAWNRAERAKRDDSHSRRLLGALDQGAAWIAFLDAKGRITQANAAFGSIFGADIIDRTAQHLLAAQTGDQVIAIGLEASRIARQTFHMPLTLHNGQSWLLLGQPYADGYWLLGVERTQERQTVKRSLPALASVQVDPSQQRLTDLRHALYFTPSQITVLAQPIGDLDTGIIAGASFGARWEHPLHPAIDDSALLVLAEEADALLPLFTQLLTAGVQHLYKWQLYQSGFKIALPVPSSLLTGGSLPRVLAAVTHYNLVDPSSIQLDCSFSRLDMATRDQLQYLRAQGYQIGICIDGAKLEDLPVFDSLPVTSLCLNRAFIQQAHSGGAAPQLVGLLAKLSTSGRQTLCAVGIDTPADAALLRQAGFTTGHGALFGAPTDLTSFTRLLATAVQLPKTA